MDTISVRTRGTTLPVEMIEDVPEGLLQDLWVIFMQNFPLGTGANKDFVTSHELDRLLKYRGVITALVNIEGSDNIGAYAIFTDNEIAIAEVAKRDIYFLRRQFPGRKIFWVFLFCANGARSYLGKESRSLFNALARYVHARNGVVMFDEDPNKGMTERIQRFLDDFGIETERRTVQTLVTTMLDPKFAEDSP